MILIWIPYLKGAQAKGASEQFQEFDRPLGNAAKKQGPSEEARRPEHRRGFDRACTSYEFTN